MIAEANVFVFWSARKVMARRPCWVTEGPVRGWHPAVHWWRHGSRRVLYLDAENPSTSSRSTGAGWQAGGVQHGQPGAERQPPDHVGVASEPDLTTIDGQHLLYEAIANTAHTCA